MDRLPATRRINTRVLDPNGISRDDVCVATKSAQCWNDLARDSSYEYPAATASGANSSLRFWSRDDRADGITAHCRADLRI